MSNQAQVPVAQTTQAIAAPIEKNITDQVLAKIQAFQDSGEIKIPKDYAVGNALKAAWVIIQEVKDRNGKLALEVCTRESIANALLKMVVWGLSPLKKQCDFIVYGNTLSCDPEYTGNIALAKRYGGLKWIKANTIFDKDVFEWEVDPETGRRRVIKHEQSLESFGSANFKGVYAIYELEDGTKDVEVMSKDQVVASWGQGASKGNSPAHQKFSDQMAQKTAINRACKLLIRSSDDSALYDKEDKDQDQVAESVKVEIKDNANKKEITFDDYSVEPVASLPEATAAQPIPTTQAQPAPVKINGAAKAQQQAQVAMGGPGF